MKKKVLVKINCLFEPQLDKKLLDKFFLKMKPYLELDHKLPEKNQTNQKVKKI